MQISELHPKLAKLPDYICLINSVTHPGGISNHFDAMHCLLPGQFGQRQLKFPIPSLDATTAFEDLDRRDPDKFEEGQLHSLQRRFREWKLEYGLRRKPVYFGLEHEPRRLLELDWFRPRDFEVMIAGESYRQMLCHCVLTYLNWEWAVTCRSESFGSLKNCLQSALWELGCVRKI